MRTPADSSTPALQGALHRAVWRWHFFAGVLVAPFALFLAVTGAMAAPPKGASLPRPVVLGVLLLACFLPLLAATLVGLLAADRLLIMARGWRRAHAPA